MGNLELQGVVAVTDEEYVWRLEEEVKQLRQASQECVFGWEDDARCLEDPDVPVEKYCVLCARRAAEAVKGGG